MSLDTKHITLHPVARKDPGPKGLVIQTLHAVTDCMGFTRRLKLPVQVATPAHYCAMLTTARLCNGLHGCEIKSGSGLHGDKPAS